MFGKLAPGMTKKKKSMQSVVMHHTEILGHYRNIMQENIFFLSNIARNLTT